jgi:hypothetical protein
MSATWEGSCSVCEQEVNEHHGWKCDLCQVIVCDEHNTSTSHTCNIETAMDVKTMPRAAWENELMSLTGVYEGYLQKFIDLYHQAKANAQSQFRISLWTSSTCACAFTDFMTQLRKLESNVKTKYPSHNTMQISWQT